MNCTKQFDQVKWQLLEQTTWCRACEMRHKWFFDHAFYHVLYDCGHVTPVPTKLQDKLHKSCCLPPLNPLRGKDALAFYPNARRFNWTKLWTLMCINYCPLYTDAYSPIRFPTEILFRFLFSIIYVATKF